jgi:DNA-binding IclR family transcriptional regulator
VCGIPNPQITCVAKHATAGSSACTITDPGVLEEQASATRARGSASEDGEYRDGVRAPVRDAAGGVIAALVARGDTAGPPIP